MDFSTEFCRCASSSRGRKRSKMPAPTTKRATHINILLSCGIMHSSEGHDGRTQMLRPGSSHVDFLTLPDDHIDDMGRSARRCFLQPDCAYRIRVATAAAAAAAFLYSKQRTTERERLLTSLTSPLPLPIELSARTAVRRARSPFRSDSRSANQARWDS